MSKRSTTTTTTAIATTIATAPNDMAADTHLTPLELERRERNRSKVRRSYYRKIYNINELRAQVDVLEDEYERILLDQERRAARLADVMTAEAIALAPTPNRQQRLHQLAQVRRRLYTENADLRRLQMDHDKAHGSLQHLVDLELQDDGARKLMARASSEVDLLRPFTLEECLAVIRVAYARVLAFVAAQKLKEPATTVLGWTDRRRVKTGSLTFCFQKTFVNRRHEDVGSATWSLLTSPRDLATLFSPYLNVGFSIVQRVDAHNVVVYRTIEQTDLDVVHKSLLLMTRVAIERGEILLVRGLDPSRVVDNALDLSRLGKRELWTDPFMWALVENPVDSTDCAFSFGGEVVTEDPSSLFWFIEVLLMVLRWETRVVGPLFELQ